MLPLAFLLGAVLGVGRLAEDREVVALSAAGITPVRLVRVPILLGGLVAAAALLNVLGRRSWWTWVLPLIMVAFCSVE